MTTHIWNDDIEKEKLQSQEQHIFNVNIVITLSTF